MHFFVLLILTVITYRIVLTKKSGANWKGSKLGTKEYKNETAVIELAKYDYMKYSNAPNKANRKALLCATFVRASISPTINFLSNILQRNIHCDWAIIIYDGSEKFERRICEEQSIQSKLVHCGRSKYFLKSKLSKSIPKTVLYTEILPYLRNYWRVFLLDEDISLLDFQTSKFLTYWDCSFPNQDPPLIVQPLVDGGKQYIDFVNSGSWANSKYIASATGLIEQQVPAFNAVFFEWFVTRVLSLTKKYAMHYGVDWGHDRSWCNAAKMYSIHVLNWSESATVCAVLIKAPKIHHLNTRAMSFKKRNATHFRLSGNKVVQKYIDLFPTWVQTDLKRKPNPLDKTYGKNYQKIKDLNSTCVNDIEKSTKYQL